MESMKNILKFLEKAQVSFAKMIEEVINSNISGKEKKWELQSLKPIKRCVDKVVKIYIKGARKMKNCSYKDGKKMMGKMGAKEKKQETREYGKMEKKEMKSKKEKK